MARRVKCSVCGLFRGAKPHTGLIHDRIFAHRKGRKHRRRRGG